MILAIVRHVSCVRTALLMNSRSGGPWLYVRPRLAFGIFQLLLQVKQLELKRGELLLAGSVGLFDGDQSLRQVGLGLEQVTLAYSLHIAIGIDASRLRRQSFVAPLPPLVSQPTLVRATMFAIVGMGLRIANDPRLFDALALRVHLAGTAADGLKRDRLALLEQLIDGGLDQS
jgi:hypothetical protein